MPAPEILVFSGTTRAGAFNKKLARAAAAALAKAGASATLLDLRELAMPLYDGDLEAAEGLPAGAKKFKALLKAHDGVLISTGEYNSSITGVLKNAIDWASRQEEGEPPAVCFKGKTGALVAASPGALGGLRALVHVRAILSNLGMILIPDQFALSKAHEAFADDGALKDARAQKSVDGIAAELVRVTAKLTG